MFVCLLCVVVLNLKQDLNRNFIAEEWHQVLGWLTSDTPYDVIDMST
jgi:hypothetical protein